MLLFNERQIELYAKNLITLNEKYKKKNFIYIYMYKTFEKTKILLYIYIHIYKQHKSART